MTRAAVLLALLAAAPLPAGVKPLHRPPAVRTARPVVNVNTATERELMLLPGIGPELASEIYDVAEVGFDLYRHDRLNPKTGWVAPPSHPECQHKCHFKTIDDLLRVRGLKAGKLAKIRPYVVLEGPTTATEKIKTTKGAK